MREARVREDTGGPAVAPPDSGGSLGTMRILACCLALAVLGTPLHAQGLEDLITDLFIFGEGDEVLFLGGSGGSDNPAVQVHGDHFIPSVTYCFCFEANTCRTSP